MPFQFHLYVLEDVIPSSFVEISTHKSASLLMALCQQAQILTRRPSNKLSPLGIWLVQERSDTNCCNEGYNILKL